MQAQAVRAFSKFFRLKLKTDSDLSAQEITEHKNRRTAIPTDINRQN